MADLLPADIARRTKQPYRAPDSASFFVDGKPLDYVAELFAPDNLRGSGCSTLPRPRLFAKAQAGKAIGFADNQAFVGVLSTLLLLRNRPGAPVAG